MNMFSSSLLAKLDSALLEKERKPQELGLCITNCFTCLWER